jgi:hypothetical protein
VDVKKNVRLGLADEDLRPGVNNPKSLFSLLLLR